MPRRRPQRLARAPAALAAAFVHLLLVADARAQSATTSPLPPSLTDPRHAQQFGRAPVPVTRAMVPAIAPLPSGAGETGYDSTGATRKKKTARRKPGAARPAPPPPPAPPGPPQQAGGHTGAPQIAARAGYSEVYRPPDAPVRRPQVPIQDAYEPLGLRVGSFLLRPSFEFARGFDSNPARVTGGSGSYYTAVEPALQVRSQWARHAYGADLRGNFTSYDTLSSSNRPQVEARTFTRFDVARDTRVDVEGRFTLSTDYPGSPNLQADIAKLPTYISYGNTAGLTQRFNRFELSLKGSVDRTQYQDSKLTDGTTSGNRDRDFDQYGGQLRASYELTPGVKPFVELGGDTRQHDLAFDRNGFQRDSRALTPKAGTTFELTRKLTGEVSVGYLTRRYQDPALPDLRGMVADAALIWTASGLTTAKLSANSRAEESAVAGVSGALRRDAALQVDHAFRRWLIGTLTLGYGFDQYIGNGREDTRTTLGTALIYKINRDLSFKGEYRRETLHSNAANVDYDASIFTIGLKLQR
ncbi:MAG: outer membrane beta-barrel protein [Xanthobacteraceae bacterium]